jgi:hypothetical protein
LRAKGSAKRFEKHWVWPEKRSVFKVSDKENVVVKKITA